MWSRLNQALSFVKIAVYRIIYKIQSPVDNSFEEIFTPFAIRPTRYRTILTWERPLSFLHTSFALYRGTTAHWDKALPVVSPIFCILDQQRQVIEYHCLDRTPEESEETYYWLVVKDQRQLEQCHGPYIMQTYKVMCLNEVVNQ